MSLGRKRLVSESESSCGLNDEEFIPHVVMDIAPEWILYGLTLWAMTLGKIQRDRLSWIDVE
jgi:hypothetical protein